MRGLPVICCLALLAATAAGAESEPVIRFVDFGSMVNPITAKRITNAIDDAETSGDNLVLIQLDTPGGLVASMEEIVKRMLAAKVPVVVWVGPAGARAASAGFFILIAADIGAMAPGTRTGAAAGIDLTGEIKEDTVLFKKVNEDLAAMIRSIADRRGRNVEACEEAVFSAKAYEERVALEMGLIDLLANDRDELVELLDGREVRLFDGTTATLRTAGARFVETEFSFAQGFMETLGIPVVAFLLLVIGLGGLYIEFTHPGLILPGVVGALCLVLFAFSTQILPVSVIGVLLILLSVAMFILEIKVTSYGMLTLGGVLCLVFGSIMLIPGPIPEMKVPLEVILPVSIALALFCALVVRLAVRAQRTRVETGVEGLVAEVGSVTEALDPEGKVFIHGEIWDARTGGDSIPVGTRVKVVRVDEMSLTVEPADARRP